MTDATAAFPAKQDVVGTGISLTSFDELVELMEDRRTDRATLITITNVHAVMDARRDPELRAALDAADITTPDGMPIAWAFALNGQSRPGARQRGKVTTTMLDAGTTRGWRHYFYGSTDETLELLQQAIKEQFDGVEIAGRHVASVPATLR